MDRTTFAERLMRLIETNYSTRGLWGKELQTMLRKRAGLYSFFDEIMDHPHEPIETIYTRMILERVCMCSNGPMADSPYGYRAVFGLELKALEEAKELLHFM